LKRVHALVIYGILLMFAKPASAQFSAFVASDLYGADTTQTQKKHLYYGSIALYPLAAFDTAGAFGNGNGTRTLAGGLYTVDLGTVLRNGLLHGKVRYEIGAWYWGNSNADLYETHFRALTRSGLGFQAGYLNTTKGFIVVPGEQNKLVTDANALDFFVLYNIHNRRAAKAAGPAVPPVPGAGRPPKYHNWNIELGVGLFVDNTPHIIGNMPSNFTRSNATTGNYTFFISGAVEVAPRVSIIASDWVIRDRAVDLNRVSVGVGWSF
jgi:hypothetical protein